MKLESALSIGRVCSGGTKHVSSVPTSLGGFDEFLLGDLDGAGARRAIELLGLPIALLDGLESILSTGHLRGVSWRVIILALGEATEVSSFVVVATSKRGSSRWRKR